MHVVSGQSATWPHPIIQEVLWRKCKIKRHARCGEDCQSKSMFGKLQIYYGQRRLESRPGYLFTTRGSPQEKVRTLSTESTPEI